MTEDRSDFTNLFTETERVLMAAWTLPNDGPLTDDQRDAAMHNFAQYTKLRGITYADVGKQVGRPKATTIRDLVLGQYRKDSDEHVRRLNAWVEQHARQEAATIKRGFVSTTHVARQMLSIARMVRENGTMGLATGASGIGKTACARAIHEKYAGAIYFRVIRERRSPMGVIRALARLVGVHKRPLRGEDLGTPMERVIATLRGSHRLIIVDEAHQLTDDGIETLRDIHDECGVPVLLVATKDLADRIRRNADPDHGQMFRRFDVIFPLTQGHEVHLGGKNKPLFTADDIKALYNEPGLRLVKPAIDYLVDVANDLGRGSLGRCDALIRNAIKVARKRLGMADGDTVTVNSGDLETVDLALRPDELEAELVRARLTRIGSGPIAVSA